MAVIISDVTLERLARLPRLRQLELADTSITDADLAHLNSARKLWKLDLGNASISGNGLLQLAGIEEVHELSLGGTDVQDEDLKHLTEMKSLVELDLSNTAITDEGLEHLIDLSSLKRLNVAGTEATPDGVEGWQKRYEKRHGSYCWVRVPNGLAAFSIALVATATLFGEEPPIGNQGQLGVPLTWTEVPDKSDQPLRTGDSPCVWATRKPPSPRSGLQGNRRR